jgi:hypothetical protein
MPISWELKFHHEVFRSHLDLHSAAAFALGAILFYGLDSAA